MTVRVRGLLVVAAVASVLVASAAMGLAKTTTITVWGWPVGDKAFASFMPDFNKKYPDIKVKVVMMDFGQVHQKLLTTLAAGSGCPDACMVEIAHIASFSGQKGLLTDLAKYGAGAYKDKFVDYKWQQATHEGKLYAFPWDVGPAAAFYRRDTLSKAGLPSDPSALAALMRTWPAFFEVSKKLVRDTNGDGKKDVWALHGGQRISEIIAQQDDCRVFDDKLTVVMDKEDSVKWLNAWKTGKSYKDVGFESPAGYWSGAWEQGIRTGTIAFVMDGVWMGGFLQTRYAPKASGLWGVVPLPGESGVNFGGSFMAIPGGSKKKAEAWKFIEYLCATSNAQNKMYRAVEYFPALKSAWEDSLYDEPVAYYAGQRVRRIFTETALKTPFIRTYRESELAQPLVYGEFSKVMAGKDVAIAIRDAATSIRRGVRGAK